VERVEPKQPTAGEECNQKEMVIRPTARNERSPKCRTESAPQEDVKKYFL
jgi:hypothetical protein